jgi:hypothetical protein
MGTAGKIKGSGSSKMRKTAMLCACAMVWMPVSAAMADRQFNTPYEGPYNSRIAFPVGGIGAGMYCVEGTGAISHMSVRGRLHAFHEPQTFAAICVKNENGNIARVLEGPVPKWKIFGMPDMARGGSIKTYGLPRFRNAVRKKRCQKKVSGTFNLGTFNLI